MRILFNISTVSGGGAARVMTCLANRFAAAGDEVALVTAYLDENEYFIDDKVKRFTLGERSEGGNTIVKNLRFIKRSRRICREYAPDVAVSFIREPNFRLLISTVGLKFKKIVSVRCDPPREYPTALLRFLAKTLYKKADGVVFQTEDAQRWFSKKIRDKSDIILNQVDERFFNTVFDGERRDIVTTGRIDPIKNHKMLVDAFSRIADKTDSNLYIYGEGRLRKSLEEQVAGLGLTDRVFMPGVTNDVIGVVSGARLFVLSSDYEGMPNSLLEALAMGVPSISTDCPCGGPRAIITDGENGLLVPVGNADMLAEKMLWALDHPDEMAKMGENAASRAYEFHPEKVYLLWREYIEKVIDK